MMGGFGEGRVARNAVAGVVAGVRTADFVADIAAA